MSTPNVQPTNSEMVANGILNVSFHASTGALAGYLFTLITPVGGAIFGAVRSVSSMVIGKTLGNFFGNTTSEKTVRFAVKFFGSILVALAVTIAAGFSFTFSAGVMLSLCMVPTALITAVAFGVFSGGVSLLD